MNIELTRIKIPAKKEEMVKEKLIEEVSKPIKMEDAQPNRNDKMLFTLVGWSHFDEALLLWLPARQLIGKMLSSRKGHIQRCFNGMQNQNKMGLLSMKTIQTLSRLWKTHNHHPMLKIHPDELHSHQRNM